MNLEIMSKEDKKENYLKDRAQAILLEIGTDREQDLEKAIEHWRKAALAGDPWAKKRLLELKQKETTKGFFKESIDSNRPTALVVDDDAAVRQELSNVFEDSFHVITCSNGNDALDYIAEQDISLMFLDIKMPQMGGIEMLHKINNPEFLDMLNIFIITGFFSPQNREQLKNFPIKGVLEKPFIKEDVIKKVAKVF